MATRKRTSKPQKGYQKKQEQTIRKIRKNHEQTTKKHEKQYEQTMKTTPVKAQANHKHQKKTRANH